MVTIAAVQAADRTEWRVLFDGYLAFYRVQLDEATIESAFARIVGSASDDGASGLHGALACDATGRAIGLAHWLTHPATWTTTDYCYLEDLFVAPDARGDGTGAALIEHVRAWAEAHGSAKLYWLTEQTNETARALYDRVATRSGFIQYQIRL